MSVKKTRVVAALAAATLALSACGGGDAENEETTSNGGAQETTTDGGGGESAGGDITLGVAYETTNYHPSNTSSALALGTNWHVVEGLYEFHMENYEVYPALAADEDPVQVSDTEYEVTLRDGAKCSDGSDVTAEDVVSSFERSMAEGNIYLSMLDFIESVEAKDDSTVTITLNKPFNLVKERLVNVKIVPASASDEDLTSMPIGSGPWKYESISEAQVIAVPNENYNGDYPAGADRMVWEVIKDDTARTTAASDGTIDIIETVPAENIEMLEAAGMTIEEVDGFNLPFLIFNTTKAPFDQKEVRQAFHYAIDTEKLVENNMSGKLKHSASTALWPRLHSMRLVGSHRLNSTSVLFARPRVFHFWPMTSRSASTLSSRQLCCLTSPRKACWTA